MGFLYKFDIFGSLYTYIVLVYKCLTKMFTKFSEIWFNIKNIIGFIIHNHIFFKVKSITINFTIGIN